MKRILMIISTLLILLASSVNYATKTGLLFNTSVDGAALNVTTVVPKHRYPTAGIKINTAGYTVTSGCTPNANGYCIFPASDTTPAALTISGPAGTMSVTLCLSGLGPYSCQTFSNIAVSSASALTARYVYVANAYGAPSDPAVFSCTVDPTTEMISACQDAGAGVVIAGTNPQGIILNNAGTRAYLTDGNGNSDIYQCNVNASNGMLSTCVVTPITSPSGYNGNGYGMLAINSTNTFVYLEDSANNDRINICPVTAGVISGVCVSNSLPNTPSQSGEAIVINRAGNTVYVTDYSDGVYVCDVSGTTVNSCILKTGGGSVTFNSNAGIALNATENLLYVTDYGNNEVYFCDTTPNGGAQFNNCSVATTTIVNAGGIAINAKNTVAYITDFSTNVHSCPILPNNTFGSCVATTGFNGTTGVTVGY